MSLDRRGRFTTVTPRSFTAALTAIAKRSAGKRFSMFMQGSIQPVGYDAVAVGNTLASTYRGRSTQRTIARFRQLEDQIYRSLIRNSGDRRGRNGIQF